MYEQIEQRILKQYGPSPASDKVRTNVIDILHMNIGKCLPNVVIFDIGSFPYKTYLSNGDIDLTIVTSQVTSEVEITILEIVLQQLEFVKKVRPQYNIEKLEIVEANVGVLKGNIMGVNFDVTVN